MAKCLGKNRKKETAAGQCSDPGVYDKLCKRSSRCIELNLGPLKPKVGTLKFSLQFAISLQY